MQKAAKSSKEQHCTRNYLHMSAKSCNFAPKFVESMKIEEMTHKPNRCRHSMYTGKHVGVYCTIIADCASDEDCKNCTHWLPSQTAVSFFAGKLTGTHAATMLSIFTERKKEGTF